MPDESAYGFETRSIHAGQSPDQETGAIMTPIFANSTYEQDAPGDDRGYEYSRTGNPTRTALEANLASLECGEYGRAFASGMAAIDAIVSLVSEGEHVITGNDVYGGTHRLFTQVYDEAAIEFSFVDTTDLEAVEAVVQPNTALIWVESPTNPLLRINDLAGLASIADDADALFGVDNTFATPYLQQPLDDGADLVCHSLTKYLGGHSDLVAGAVVTNDEQVDEALGFQQNAVGGVPSPFDCFLVLRGTKSLGPRMDRHCHNASELATWLQGHDAVAEVYYPGLESHPGHDLATRQMDDYGGMVSLELHATLEETSEIVAATEVFTLAESLGGVESLIEQPATMTHATIPKDERDAAGLTDGLIRLSVGTEQIEDLKADLDQAMTTVL